MPGPGMSSFSPPGGSRPWQACRALRKARLVESRSLPGLPLRLSWPALVGQEILDPMRAHALRKGEHAWVELRLHYTEAAWVGAKGLAGSSSQPKHGRRRTSVEQNSAFSVRIADAVDPRCTPAGNELLALCLIAHPEA